ncbi:MAG TPA: Ig domain-containing protein [Verrucomicrobiae bacterium]|nr:Ig domain-containing protein [Verrucomicrobiae bacterium]
MKPLIQPLFFSLALLAGLTGSVNAVPTFIITPPNVSNTYVGPITLQLSNLTVGDTVVIQKFGMVVSNGMLAPGDVLVQQFNLTDGQAGMVISGVTNINVPGDTDGTTNGQITAILPFPADEFIQKIVGQYGFVLSSPGGHFSPITNLFAVTNFPFAQQISGTVLTNGVGVPYATIMLFPPPRSGNHGPGNPVAGTVADGSGVYHILVPPGAYLPLAFQSNCVGSFLASPVLTLTNTQTINANLMLTNATASISGTVVDILNPSIGLPGLFLPADNNSGFIASGFSDTNGMFTIWVTSGQWQLSGGARGLGVHGYVAFNNGTNVAAGTSGFVGGFYKATALFYGTVKDNLGNPLPGIDISAYDNNNNIFGNDGYSDINGNYVVGVVGGLGSGDPWQIQVANGSDNSNPTNYIFSQSALQQSGGTNLAAGNVVLQNFTGLLATNQITGRVQSSGTNLVGVGMFASASIGGLTYNATADTDANGNYTLHVANGVWSVGVDCNGGNGSLDSILGPGNYQCPASQNLTNSGTANFNVLPSNAGQIFGYVWDPGSQPVTNVIVYANNGVGNNFATNTDGNGYYSFVVGNGNWGVSLDCGQLNSLGYRCVGTNFTSISGNSYQQDFTLQSTNLPPPLQILTTSLPNGTNGIFYSQTFQVSGGMPPYHWFIPNYSVPPLGLGLPNNGVLSGTPTMNGKFYFDVVVTDSASNYVEEDGLALTILNNPPLPPVVITNTSLGGGTVGVPYNAQLGATGGQSPYNWSLAIGSANPPPGLTLNSSGFISGTPVSGGTYFFQVQATDAYATTTNKVFSIAVAAVVPRPTISSPARLGGQFQMLLNGVANQNYTLQMSTNLATPSWVTLYITNNPATNSFLLTDPGATNKQRFYRVLVGP